MRCLQIIFAIFLASAKVGSMKSCQAALSCTSFEHRWGQDFGPSIQNKECCKLEHRFELKKCVCVFQQTLVSLTIVSRFQRTALEVHPQEI